jgi:alpha-glucosidase
MTLAIGLVRLLLVQAAAAVEIRSPQDVITLEVSAGPAGETAGGVWYQVHYRGQPLVASSRLGFLLADGEEIGTSGERFSHEVTEHDATWRPVYGERTSIRDAYRQLTLRLRTPHRDWTVEFRCYDAGIAFRSTLGGSANSPGVEIVEERSEFAFLEDHAAWCATSAQGEYSRKRLGTMGSNVERPLTLECDDATYLAIAEAGLVDYARMKLQQAAHRPCCVVSQLSGGVRAAGSLTTPWRVVMIAPSPGRLLENNDLLLNLNQPCALEDTSWIQPGKVIREVTLTTAGGRACIDFAARHRLQFVEFDAGWYGHEYDDASDATTVTVDPKRSAGPLELRALIDYAASRGVGVILYVNRRALERQLDEILPLYHSWGVKGVKFGFVNVGSQEWTRWLHEAVRKAADCQLMVDIHDEYRPTGFSRTYPNLMTQEGIRGDEATPSNELTLTLLFTRMLAGAADNTICYFDGRVEQNSCHAYQLAKAVCIYDPWQFLYWYDTPLTDSRKPGGENHIVETPELEFWDRMPTVWDDTRVLHGKIGEYAVVARRSGDEWFLGAMNDRHPRVLETPLDFLDPQHTYVARRYVHDPGVETRTHVGIRQQQVDRGSSLSIGMHRNGGEAIHLVPLRRVPSATAEEP